MQDRRRGDARDQGVDVAPDADRPRRPPKRGANLRRERHDDVIRTFVLQPVLEIAEQFNLGFFLRGEIVLSRLATLKRVAS